MTKFWGNTCLRLKKKEAKYTSKTIENQIIQMIGDFIRDKILHAVRENVFSLISDEVTDISNKEILSLCVRYVSMSPKIQIKEIFINFVQFIRAYKSNSVWFAIHASFYYVKK